MIRSLSFCCRSVYENTEVATHAEEIGVLFKKRVARSDYKFNFLFGEWQFRNASGAALSWVRVCAMPQARFASRFRSQNEARPRTNPPPGRATRPTN